MRKKMSLILPLAGLLVLFAGAYLFYSTFAGEQTRPGRIESGAQEQAADTSDGGAEIPDFLAETRDGESVRLSDLLDRPTIIYFWTSWCTWCTLGMEELDQVYAETDGVQVLAVNLSQFGGGGNELENAKVFLAEQGYLFPALFDVHGEAQAAYAITGVPAMLFVNSDGTQSHAQLGFLDAEDITYFAAMLS